MHKKGLSSWECSVSATILEKGRPVCEWLVCKNADNCNSDLQYSSSSSSSQVLWVSLASHNQLRYTLLVVEMYSSGCTSVHGTCTHSRLYIYSDYPSAHCKSKQIIPSSGQFIISHNNIQ